MPARSSDVVRFIGGLRNTKGKYASSPFHVHEFQRDWISQILALDRHGRRKVREFLLGVARKNGKTELIAALSLALLMLDEEPGGDVIIAAGKRDQARILLNAARKMANTGTVGGTPLSTWLDVRRDYIYFPEMDARIVAVSADAQNEQGLNPNIAIVDELHVASEKNDDLYQALMTAQGARENPLMVAITTAGPVPSGPCHDLYKYGTEIARGLRSDDDFRMIWHEAGPDAAVDDPAAWQAANPALDKFLYRAFLEKESRAVLSGKKPEYVFRRLHLNSWTTALERWLPFSKWQACSAHPEIEPGDPIVIGIDAALSRDSFGVAWVRVEEFEEVSDDEEESPVRSQRIHAKAKKFEPLVEGGYIDPADVETFVLGLGARHPITKAYYDPAYMGLLASSLAERGVPMEPFPQSAERMTRASETFQRIVLDGRLRHGGDPMLSEQLAATGTRTGERGVRISKQRSGRKIDAVIALAMAIDGAVGDTEEEAEDFLFLD